MKIEDIEKWLTKFRNAPIRTIFILMFILSLSLLSVWLFKYVETTAVKQAERNQEKKSASKVQRRSLIQMPIPTRTEVKTYLASIDEKRSKSLYPHPESDCTDTCKARGKTTMALS